MTELPYCLPVDDFTFLKADFTLDIWTSFRTFCRDKKKFKGETDREVGSCFLLVSFEHSPGYYSISPLGLSVPGTGVPRISDPSLRLEVN